MNTQAVVWVRGHISAGDGHWGDRLMRHSAAFARALGVRLYAGTLNVLAPCAVPIRAGIRVSGLEMDSDEQDYLCEPCTVFAGHDAPDGLVLSVFRVRPYHRANGFGGHGDHMLEIVSPVRLRDVPGLAEDGSPVTVGFYRPDLVGFV
jgi:hypothetical protein